MFWLIIAAVVLVIAVSILAKAKGKPEADESPRAGSSLPYRKAASILKPDERQFFEVLLRAVGNQYLIFPKVGVTHLLQIEAKGKEFFAARGRISQRTADFVLVIPDTYAPALVIELDKPSQQETEGKLDAIYQKAGLACIHVPTGRDWDAAGLAATINQAFSRANAAPTQSRR